MADIEITDEASLEAWLKTRPRRDAEIIAFRAAARVFPLWGRAMEEEWAISKLDDAHNLIDVLQFRNLLAFQYACIASQKNADDGFGTLEKLLTIVTANTNLAEDAKIAFSYYSASVNRKVSQRVSNLFEDREFGYAELADSLDDLAAAETSASNASHNAFSSWEIISSEFGTLIDERELFRSPLWPTQPPDWFTTADRETRAIWAKDPATWAFWEKWWDGVISGDMPFPPDLLRDVALIEDDIWQAGPKAVAAAIDKLITARALAMTDNGESVEINPETGKLRLVGADTLPPDIDRYARRKMAKALALFEGELSNQYRPLNAPLRTIRAALGDTENLPNELFDACASATRMTAILVETQSIPAPEQDPLIGEFVASLRETAADILAADTKTQDILTKRKAVMGNDTLIANAGDINIVVGQIVVVSEGALQRMLPENADAALNPNAHPEERNIGAFKLSSWLLRVNRVIREIGGTVADYKEVGALFAILANRPEFQSAIAAILKYLGLG